MLKQMLKALTIFTITILAMSQLAFAQIDEFKIGASDGTVSDQFGVSVSITGDYAVVGTFADDDNGSASGSAYIFKRSGTSWTQEAKLLPSDGEENDYFGWSVSIDGDYAVVGAYREDENGTDAGSAYIFKRNGTIWTQEAKLLSSDGATFDNFGKSVSISGNYAVVGTFADDDNGDFSGAAYVFKRDGTSWAQEAKLLPSDGAEGDWFGASVSIDGDYTAVGAYKEDENGTDAGSAYIFKRNGTIWTQEVKLLPSDGAVTDYFGWSVSISDDYAVVGALHNDNTGSAYVFKRSGTSWAQEDKLVSSDGATEDWFGIGISISGDFVIVGAEQDDDNGDRSGSAYLFKRTGTSWAQDTKLLPSDGASIDLFGKSVSISDDYVIVSSLGDDDNGSNSGSAYIYTNYILPSSIHVPGEYSTIQAAIDAAIDGDTLLVQPGTYTENINFSGKSILLISSDGADVTIVDGNLSGSVVTFTSGENENSKLVGFTLSNGSGNNGTEGGGIYCIDSSPSIVRCKIINNTVTSSAGGIYLSGSSPILDHCIISGNTSGASSGGLKLVNSSSPKIIYCVITGNSAQYGGGMSIYSGSSPWLINCTISGNYASIQGGGMYVHGSGTNPIMVNSLMWDDAAGSSGQDMYICCGPAMTITHSDVNPSDITGSVSNMSDNINADPLFLSALAAGDAPIIGGDYQLSLGSPAIDAGVSFYVSGSDTLVNLSPIQYVGSAPDLGAFEYSAPELSVLPDSLDFGAVLVGETVTEQVIIKNIGTADLNVTSIAITGVDSPNFSVDTTLFTLTPSDSILLDVSFIPDAIGSYSALLEMNSDGGSASVSLTGIGEENQSPNPFLLIAPEDSSEVVTLNPLLYWHRAIDPNFTDEVSYTVYIGNEIPNQTYYSVGMDTFFTIPQSLSDNTTYYWKVVATDLSGVTTENTRGYWSFRVNTENDLPGDFALLSPENGLMVTDLTPTFLWEEPVDPDDGRSNIELNDLLSDVRSSTWTNSRSITSYNVSVSTDSTFTGVIPDTVTTNSYTQSTDLNEDMVYYWKVEAIDDDGGVTGSARWSFWTNSQNSLPSNFSVISPVNRTNVDTLLPTFTWHPSIDYDLNDMMVYNIYLGESIEDIESVYTGFTPWITDTTFTLIEPITDNTTYYWYVLATDLSGATRMNFEGFQSFSVNLGNEPPSVVELISPDSVVVLTLTSEFHWTEAIDPDPDDSVHYEIHWVKDGNDFVDSVLTDTNYAIPYTPLEDNSKFFWWVISMDRQYDLSESEEAIFWTDLYPEPPLAFNTVSPIDSAEGLPIEVEFIWNTANDPDPLDNVSYILVYATDWADSSTYEFLTVYDDTTVTVTLTNDTGYFWWVMASDEDELFTLSNNGTVNRLVVGTLSIGDDLVPIEFALHQNYPNPFNPITTLRYDLPENNFVNITIYDLLGRKVTTLVNKTQEAGYKSVIWNATNDNGKPVSAGMYLYRISAGEFVQTKKMVLLK